VLKNGNKFLRIWRFAWKTSFRGKYIERMKNLVLKGNSVREIAKQMGISKSLVHKTLVLSPLLSRYSCGARRNPEICS